MPSQWNYAAVASFACEIGSSSAGKTRGQRSGRPRIRRRRGPWSNFRGAAKIGPRCTREGVRSFHLMQCIFRLRSCAKSLTVCDATLTTDHDIVSRPDICGRLVAIFATSRKLGRHWPLPFRIHSLVLLQNRGAANRQQARAAYAEHTLPLAGETRAQGSILQDIADKLNADGIPRGGTPITPPSTDRG